MTAVARHATCALLLASALVAGGCQCSRPFDAEYRKFEAVAVGWTEEQVVAHLGEPARVYTRETAPKDYFVKGYGYKSRPITNKVWIYIGSEPIAYVYFDLRERVEEVVVRGS